jgi:hypothetical protein
VIVVVFLVVFSTTSSFEYPIVRFPLACVRYTLINGWEPDGLRVVKGYILWVGQVKRKRDGGNPYNYRRIPMGYMIYEL